MLLDVDGTLIDSNGAHAAAWSDALREFGFDIGAARVRPLIGMGGDKVLPELTGLSPDGAKGKALAARRAEIFRDRYVPALRPTPGAHALLERFRHEGLTLVVATSAQEDELRSMLEQVGLDELLDGTTTSDDADRSKPDPDIVVAALREAKLDPSTALMLGDTPYDVAAARRASVGVVAVLSGGWDADALDGAIAIYEHPADILTHFTASPFASAT